MKYLAIALFLGLGLQAQKVSTRAGYIKFFSDAAVEDIEAENKQVSSILNLENGQFAFLVPIKAFQFEKALMQEHFNENYLESGQYPNASFKGSIEDYAKIDLSKDGVHNLVFAGKMTLHGVEKSIKEKVLVEVKGGKLGLSSSFKLLASDYEVKIPSSKQDNISNELAITVKMQYD